MTSLPSQKLGYDIDDIEHEFDRWQRERTNDSRKTFDEMLHENPFVEFWGRLGKIGGEGVEGGVKRDDEDVDDGEGGGGNVDMKVLAKNVDLSDMEKVLKVGLVLRDSSVSVLTPLYRMTSGISCLIMFLSNECAGLGYVFHTFLYLFCLVFS